MKTTIFIPEQKNPYFTMKPLTLTVKKDLSSIKKALSKDDFNRFISLHKLAQETPKKAFKGVKELLTHYPNHPELLNLMTYIYLARRKIGRANQLITLNYMHNPDYLIGKINYADLCIRKGKTNQIPIIFNETFDLRNLAPTTSLFQLSEYRGFMVVMSFYQLALKKQEAAEAYFYLAHTVDRLHPSVQILKKKLFKKSLFIKLTLTWKSIYNKIVAMKKIFNKICLFTLCVFSLPFIVYGSSLEAPKANHHSQYLIGKIGYLDLNLVIDQNKKVKQLEKHVSKGK